MVLTHIDLKYVSLIYRKIRQKVPNGKGLITQYYHNITQLGVKCLHLIRYSTLPNRGPPPSLNQNNTLADMPTYNLLIY